MTEKTTIRKHHFTIDSSLVMNLARQAYWMENHKDWAIRTLKCLDGITLAQIDSVLRGTAILKPSTDFEKVLYEETPDIEWQQELAKFLQWQESTTYTFGGHKIAKELVDTYVNDVVGRLRRAMVTGFINTDAIGLLELERQRENLHNEIIMAAGFTQQDIDNRTKHSLWTEDYKLFDAEFTNYLDEQTAWVFPKRL